MKIKILPDEAIIKAYRKSGFTEELRGIFGWRRIAQEAKTYTIEQMVEWLIANYSCEQKLVIIPEDELKKLGG